MYLLVGSGRGIIGLGLRIIIRLELGQPGSLLGDDQIYNVVVTSFLLLILLMWFFLFLKSLKNNFNFNITTQGCLSLSINNLISIFGYKLLLFTLPVIFSLPVIWIGWDGFSYDTAVNIVFRLNIFSNQGTNLSIGFCDRISNNHPVKSLVLLPKTQYPFFNRYFFNDIKRPGYVVPEIEGKINILELTKYICSLD